MNELLYDIRKIMKQFTVGIRMNNTFLIRYNKTTRKKNFTQMLRGIHRSIGSLCKIFKGRQLKQTKNLAMLVEKTRYLSVQDSLVIES